MTDRTVAEMLTALDDKADGTIEKVETHTADNDRHLTETDREKLEASRMTWLRH